jgi:two-component system sensor histidine kinase ChvG
MVETLSERMTATERFAADVAHELKNPLTSLKSAVETALIVKNKEDLKKLLGIIRHDIERLDRLITDISSTSKLDAELSRSVFSTVDIKILLQNIIESHRDPLVRGRNGLQTKVMASGKVDIELKEQEDEKFYTHGMGHRLAQVFQNLLDNALSFSPPNSKITISLTRRLGAIIVVLEDEGPGIPETKLETIFERFYSERPETESFGNHSGLGLSICRQIILAHQGRIFAENRKDQSGTTIGARFTAILNQSENQV